MKWIASLPNGPREAFPLVVFEHVSGIFKLSVFVASSDFRIFGLKIIICFSGSKIKLFEDKYVIYNFVCVNAYQPCAR